MNEYHWLENDADSSNRILADVFMTMALLLLMLMWRSIILPENVEVPSSLIVPADVANQWVHIDLSEKPFVVNGKSYPTFEALLLAIEPDIYIEIDGSNSSGSEVIRAQQKVQALGVGRVFFTPGD